MNPIPYPSAPLVKVCGLTRKEDVDLCHSLDVDFTGFIFSSASKRRISPETAAVMPQGKAARVGVFTHTPPQEVLNLMNLANLRYAQLHSGEDSAFCAAIGSERVIKVLWPEAMTQHELQAGINHFTPFCSYFLFDAGKQGGGSGKTIDCAFLNDIYIPKPWFLAGGLGPETLTSLLQKSAPPGIDLNSAVEISPGVKDKTKLAASLRIIRSRHDKKPISKKDFP